jgi:hypothetical protein
MHVPPDNFSKLTVPSEDMIQAMACSYRAGATARELAIAYDLSLSSVKRLLRTAGIRRAPSNRGSAKVRPTATDT